jgi:hypothetical protein
MQKARCYLAVPFAQKDEAKGLGARWDPARKLWYVPEGVDTAPFQRWFSADPALQNAPAVASSAKRPGSAPRKMESPGVVIPSTLPDFVPYSGDIPPWE